MVTVYWEECGLKQTSPGQQDHLLHSEKKPLPSQEILVAIRFPSTVLLGADVFVAHTESQFSVANRKCLRTQKSLRSPTICGKEWLSVISKPPQQEYHSNTVKNQPSSKTTCKEAPSGKKNVRHTPNDITENYSNSSTLWKNPTGLPTPCAEGADLSGNLLRIQRPEKYQAHLWILCEKDLENEYKLFHVDDLQIIISAFERCLPGLQA